MKGGTFLGLLPIGEVCRCPQLQFLNLLFMPVVMRTLVEIPQVQFSVQFVPVVTPTLVEIPQVQFLDKVYMSIVVSGAVGQTVQKTVEYPQLQFFDKVFIPVVVVSGADGQTVQKTVEYPQLQFQDKAQTMSSWSLLWRRCKSRSVLDRALFLGRILR